MTVSWRLGVFLMDVIDILGSLLGQKSSGGGRGGDILKDILPGGSRSSKPSSGSKPMDLDRQAKELEDLLNVAKHRQAGSEQPKTQPTPPARGPVDTREPQTSATGDAAHALILVRAMVNAAKADGQIDEEEQKNMLSQVNSPSRENVEFLRKECQRPLDVREFAMSVPVGMEQQVYTMSLIGIKLDTGAEAKYLMELAEALRIP
ncbi:MAG: DUF533 domain-containing protein, partial [Aureliella sp.]